MMGNRGGRLHRDDQTLSGSRWKTKHWLICVCEFKGRQRDVWGRYYTELFFLDEPTALAAGHRPCFECRRPAAKAFIAAFPGAPSRVEAMDEALHRERVENRRKRLWRRGSATCRTGRSSPATGALLLCAWARFCRGASPAMGRRRRSRRTRSPRSYPALDRRRAQRRLSAAVGGGAERFGLTGIGGGPSPPVSPAERRSGVARERRVWVFLGRGRLDAKTLVYEGWKSLDFLGFCPNSTFSMGYAGISLK